jgi:hypothetical protein
MADWISVPFPTDDPEAFTEALERCILGDFGPTLDALVDHARETPVFRGCLLMSCEDILMNDWDDGDQDALREQRILIGVFNIAMRVPIDLAATVVQDWFDRHSAALAKSELTRLLGGQALSVLRRVEPEPSSELLAWWALLMDMPVWGEIAVKLFTPPTE